MRCSALSKKMSHHTSSQQTSRYTQSAFLRCCWGWGDFWRFSFRHVWNVVDVPVLKEAAGWTSYEWSGSFILTTYSMKITQLFDVCPLCWWGVWMNYLEGSKNFPPLLLVVGAIVTLKGRRAGRWGTLCVCLSSLEARLHQRSHHRIMYFMWSANVTFSCCYGNRIYLKSVHPVQSKLYVHV